jgi:hypothetical protein
MSWWTSPEYALNNSSSWELLNVCSFAGMNTASRVYVFRTKSLCEFESRSMVSSSLIRESKTFVNSSSSVSKGKELARVSIVGFRQYRDSLRRTVLAFSILRAVPESKLMWLRCGTQIDPIKCKFATASTRPSSKVRALKLPSSGLGLAHINHIEPHRNTKEVYSVQFRGDGV